MVDFAGGRVVESVNLPLTDVPLRDLLTERFAVPVALDNDATAATVGEHVFGAGRGARDMVMLTLGTGVGGGIIADGRPYRGRSGAAAELGHMLVDVDGPACPADCPGRGCLEAYVSGTAMGAAALAEARAHPDSALGRALAGGETVDSRLLTSLALAGDARAVAVLERVGELLGAGLTTIVNVFNPELVVIGGGAAAAGELLFTPARRVLSRRALAPNRDQVRVVAASFGADAGVVGAAALALTEAFPQDAAAPH
jgi:glucokinase